MGALAQAANQVAQVRTLQGPRRSQRAAPVLRSAHTAVALHTQRAQDSSKVSTALANFNPSSGCCAAACKFGAALCGCNSQVCGCQERDRT